MMSLFIILLCIFIMAGPFVFIYFKPYVEGKIEHKKEDWKGIITFWDYPRVDIVSGSNYGWIVSKIKKFEKENPGVYIDLKPIGFDSGPIEIETAIRTKTYPDIAPVGADVGIICQNILEPVDAFFTQEEKQDYKKQALDAVSEHGSIWGFPCMMSTYTMILNMDLFNEKGVRPPQNGQWTYSEFVDTLKKLTYDQDGDGHNDVYGFNSFIGPNDYNIWGILLSDGAKVFDPNLKYKFYGKSAESGLQKLADLKLKYKVTPSDFGENSESKAWKSFCEEKKVAVYPTGTWAINALSKLQQKGEGFEFEIAKYPIGGKGDSVSVAKITSAYGIFKQEDKEKLQVCVKFLKFLSQDKYQKELTKIGMFPVKKSVGEIYQDNRFMNRIEKSLEDAQNIPMHSNWVEIEGFIQSQIRQVLLKDKRVNKALEDAKTKIFMYQKMNNSRP
ncbi:extracellular solute-binding protein [Lutibacter sp. B2]|nr:extracellular solute-binding protein [Lutibacter sp. B2]